MDWIKAKYDRAILLAAAVILLASSVFVYLQTSGFGGHFAAYHADYTKNRVVKELSLLPITEAQNTFSNPAQWQPMKPSLYVSRQIVLTPEGSIREVGPEGAPYFPGFENKWFFDNGLNILQRDILDQDTDSDKYTNREEYLGKTNPRDPKSFPPLTNKLFLKKFVQTPFRIVFNARDDQTCQINTIDLKQPSQFLKVPDAIKGTKFKLEKLTIKDCVNPLGTPVDCSELLIRNVDTNEPIILVVGQLTNSPDVFADFFYLWDNSQFRVKKNGEFRLKPDDATTYKLVDINSSEATIQNLSTSAQIKIPSVK